MAERWQRTPNPVGPVVGETVALLERPEAEGEDWPIWQTHLEWSRKHDEQDTTCTGLLRWDHQDGPVWSALCDGCGFRIGVSRLRVDREARIERRVKASGLPERFLERELEPTDGNRDALFAVRDMLANWARPDDADTDWERPRPPMLCGANGRGKTHLIVRAAARLIQQHDVELAYCTFADLLDEAKLAMDTKGASSQAVFDRAASVPVLVLDDLGAGLGSDWSRNTLEALVDRRYRKRLPIMGTTNVLPDQWREEFGPRTGSRLMELCAPVLVTGEDWRLR